MAMLSCYCGCGCWGRFLVAAAPVCEEDPPDRKLYPKAYAKWLEDCDCEVAKPPNFKSNPAARAKWERECQEASRRKKVLAFMNTRGGAAESATLLKK